MKKLYILPLLLIAVQSVSAQYSSIGEILKVSMTNNAGTARSAAMGGAFGALGGDLSSFNSNPAGIGVFRKSEISITPALNFARTTSANRSISDPSFQMGDLGGVVAFYSPSFNWKGFNFGINYTNLNNFNRKTNQHVNNSNSSLTGVIALQSDGIEPYDLNYDGSLGNTIQGLAYQTYLTDTVGRTEDGIPLYGSLFGGSQQPVNQRKMIKEDGYQGEYAFSFGTNYKDKLYLGLTIGVRDLEYRMKSVYTEAAVNQDNMLGSFDYEEKLKISGVGTNFKVGIIYRPIPELRIGAAIHTPTFYSITETFSNGVSSHFRLSPSPNGEYDFLSATDPTSYSYDLKTPWKAVFGLATVLNQKLIVSADYEYTNYSNILLSDGEDGYDFYDSGDASGINDDIKYAFKATHKIKFGAEYRCNSVFSVRAGYNYTTSPSAKIYELNNTHQALSAGFGLNFGTFFCDAAYLYDKTKSTTQFYNYLDAYDPAYDIVATPVKNTYVNHQARITLGVRF